MPIAGVFGALLIISNVLSGKIVAVGSMSFPGGAILFPLTYIFGDVLTEVYGYSNARRVIWAGLAGALLWAVSYWIVAALPGASFWHKQEAFEQILGVGPRLALAGILAYLVGEFVNSYILARMKVYTAGRYLSARLIVSTIAGQALDTALVLSVAFSDAFTFGQLLEMGFSLWAVKVGWEVFALPITIPTVRWLKGAEQEDFFDTHTNFNPLVLASESGYGGQVVSKKPPLGRG